MMVYIQLTKMFIFFFQSYFPNKNITLNQNHSSSEKRYLFSMKRLFIGYEFNILSYTNPVKYINCNMSLYIYINYNECLAWVPMQNNTSI